MKKFLYSAAALALAFFAGSCQRENLEPVAGSGKVTYTVQVPGAIATKADYSDGFVLTYEVYRDGDLDDMDADPIYEGTKEFLGGKADLTLEFVKDQKFTVLFWAQKEDAYDLDDLRAVSFKANANAEVFAGKDHVVSCASETDGMVSLVRPVGQINIATLTSGLTLGATTTVVPTHSMVTVSGLYTTYNVATKEVSGTHSVAFAKESVPEAAFDGYADYTPVATTYTGFMPTEGSTVDVDFKIYTENDGEITHSVPQVPVKANVRTYIIGNLVTATDDYTITLDETWPDEKNEVEVVWVSVSSAQGLQEAIDEAEGGKITNITLEGDIDLSTLAGLVSTKAAAPTYGVNIPYGKQLVLDLNGSTISQTVKQTSGYSMIQNDGELVIIDSKGTGRISYKDSGNGGEYISNTITNRGILTIKGGIIENITSEATADVGYAYTIDTSVWGESSEVVVNIEGGTLKSLYSPLRLNGASSTKAVVANISGGELYGRIDHQMSTSTPAKAVLNITGGTFNAYGLKTDVIMVFGSGADSDASGIELNVAGGTFNAPILIYRGAGVTLGQGFNENFITDGTFAWNPTAFVAPGKAAVKDGQVWVIADAEVSVNGVGYLTLADALAAVEAEAEVKLFRDVNIESIVVPAGKNITLDLNGKTLAGESSTAGKNYDMIDVRGTLTVKNGTLTAEFKGTNMGWSASTNVFNVTAGGVLNLRNVAAKNLGGSDMGFVAHLNNWGEVTLNVEDSNLESNYVAVRVFNSGYDPNNVTIRNSVLKGGSYAFWVHNYTADDFGSADKAASQAELLNFDIFDNGNTFIGKNDTPIRYGMTNSIYQGAESAVKIGETVYSSISEAVAAAENGETIVLTRNIKQVDGVIVTDKNLTIDLNNKTFTVTEGASTNNRNFKINGSSVVTIMNGTMVAAGDYSSGAYGTIRTEGTANVTLNNLKLYNSRGNGLNVKALSGTTVTINDTEIYSQYGGGVEAAGGIVELNKVTVKQEGMYTAPYNSMTISVNGGGTATVNSGVYSTKCITAEEANNQGTSHGPWCAGVLNSGGTLIINGGTFSNDNFGDDALATAARGLLLADTDANIQINDGTFNAVKKIIDIQNNLGDASRNPKATLQGGTYSSNPLTWDGLISVVEGKEPVESTDGRWTLVRVQQNNEIWYTSDEMKLEPTTPTAFNANIVSNVWDSTTGKGVITFDAPLTAIGNEAFKRITNTTPSNWITSISLPNSVETIGDYAFYHCCPVKVPDDYYKV